MAEKKEKQYVSDNAQLMAEWNWAKNIGISPNEITTGSGRRIWWICSKSHKWEETPNQRISHKQGCPYCSNHRILVGFNDLATTNSALAAEWHPTKNQNLTPYDVTYGSGKKVWWICNKGHEWQSTISNRHNENGCPVCSSERKTSLPEYALVYYLDQYGYSPVHSYKELGYELDIYIPSKKIGIEYDGYLWHKNKIENDLRKNQQCQRDGIRLYRIREGLLPLHDSSVDFIVQRTQKNLEEILAKVLCAITGTNVDVNLERDAIAIESLRQYTEKESSLKFSNPALAAEWHYDKNGSLRPESVFPNSNKKVWWRCNNGHEWYAAINSRNSGKGCPFCAGQKVISGYNDLKTVNPGLTAEWDYKNNNGMSPGEVMPNSDRKVWWICNKGHGWQATIASRNRGNGCPYCSGRYAISGINDFKTLNPSLMSEWNYKRNGELNPEDLAANSHKKVWWKCHEGHEWQATIAHRNNGLGCPYCSGRYPIKGKNDLKTVNPHLAAEWNYKKNNGLRPEDVLPNSNKKVWWTCIKGHEWEAAIDNRNNGRGCPYCSEKRVLIGYNDLQTVNPSLATEWNFERNSGSTPNMFTANSGKKVWWLCKEGHEWQAVIKNRNKGTGCPECYRKQK